MSPTAVKRDAVPAVDEALHAPTAGQLEMVCWCRVFVSHPFVTVILSDAGEGNPGPSITNGIEYAARAFAQRFPCYPRERLVFVEHYPEPHYGGESFDLVSFSAPESYSGPRWMHTDKAAVEKLVGGTLP